MKKLTIAMIVVLLCASLLAACTPGVLMDWIASIGSGSMASSGNAVTFGNTLPFVSYGSVAFATAGDAFLVSAGNATPGNAMFASAGNAVFASAGNALATPGNGEPAGEKAVAQSGNVQ